MNFDARAIKLLPVGEHITSSEHPGLRLEALPDRRTWTYRYRSPIDSKLRQIKIGTWPATSIHAAVTAWEVYRQQREAGRDPALEAKAVRSDERATAAAAKKKKSKPYTVADVANEYWEGHIVVSRKPKGVTEVRRMFDKMLGDVGAVPAVDLTRAQAFDLLKSHAEDRPVVAGYLRTELGAAWDYAIDAGRLPEACPNWWRLIMRGKLKSKGKKIAGENIGTKKRALSPAEVGVLIRWLPNFTQLISDALVMYLWTCCRGAEILTMEGKEVRLEGDTYWWVVPKEKTKNAHVDSAGDLRVPLFGRALAVVRRRIDRYGDGALFPARRRDGRIVCVEQKTIQSTVWFHQPYSTTRPESERPRLPVTHWAPHDLRRTSRTLLASKGCEYEVGESILGHVLPGVLGVYNVHAYDAERVKWLRLLSDYLEQIASEEVAAS